MKLSTIQPPIPGEDKINLPPLNHSRTSWIPCASLVFILIYALCLTISTEARDLIALPNQPNSAGNQIQYLSGDATAAIGYSWVNNAPVPWRWNPSTGYTPWSGPVAPGDHWEEGRKFSGVEVHSLPDNQFQFVPWHWTEEQGLQSEPPVAIPTPLNENPFKDHSSGAFMAADGLSVVVRTDTESGSQEIPALLWTRKNGFRSLSPISYIAGGHGISRDASLIAGFGWGGGNSWWLWSASAGFTQLTAPAGHEINFNPGWRVSLDGSVAVAAAWNSGTRQSSLLRWTAATGVQLIPLATEPWPNQTLYVAHISADGSAITGTGVFEPNAVNYTAQRVWRWSETEGFEIFGLPEILCSASDTHAVAAVSQDGSAIFGLTGSPNYHLWRWTRQTGVRLVRDDFPGNAWIDSRGSGAEGGLGKYISSDGNVVIGSSFNLLGTRQSWIAAYVPVIEKLSTQTAVSGGGDVRTVVYGIGFEPGTKVTFGNVELTPDSITPTEIHLTIPSNLISTILDFQTYEVRVVCPGGDESRPHGFTVISASLGDIVSGIETGVATTGTTVTVELPPATETSGGISAALTVNTADSAASVTVASYIDNPSGSANTSFDVAGSYVDLNASGVTAEDSLQAFFYFPSDTPVDRLVLKFWNTRLSPPDWDMVAPITIQPEVGRVDVVFNATSHPAITELDGTFFAAVVLPPLQFTGFLAPIGGADDTGGSVSTPVRTFKAGSTIPVKFTVTQGETAITDGNHTLTVQQFSASTPMGAAIDAISQGGANTGNQFVSKDGKWQFNLDTKATGMRRGIWKLTATLADQSEHFVWIQLK